MPDPQQTLAPQFRAILQRYTKSARIDEMVADLIEAVVRDAPRIEIPVPVEPCQHITRLIRHEDGKKRLVCKKCQKVIPF